MLEKLKKELLEGLPEETFYNMDVEEYHQHIESVFSRVRVDKNELVRIFSLHRNMFVVGASFESFINAISKLDFIEVGEEEE